MVSTLIINLTIPKVTHRNDLCVETRPVLSVLQSIVLDGLSVPLAAVRHVPIPATRIETSSLKNYE